jgi:cyanate permease
VRDRWQTRTVGLAILPALLLGAGLSFALLERGEIGVLPGVWYGCYGVGLFASRTMLPNRVLPIAAAFLLTGVGLLFAPHSVALAWWVLPVGFGIGQIVIGALVRRDARIRNGTAEARL